MNLAVVVGNGFSLDCDREVGHTGLNHAQPLTWPVHIPAEQVTALPEALPNLFAALSRFTEEQITNHQFELFRRLTNEDLFPMDVTCEARHALVLCYRLLTKRLFEADLTNWPWFKWFLRYRADIVTTVSFNYDLLLERVLKMVGREIHRSTSIKRGSLNVMKPHGSVDFEIANLTRGHLQYPLRMFAAMTNGNVRIIPPKDWAHAAPSEPLVVLPLEKNPYKSFQWIRHGYPVFKRFGSGLTHCVFLGLSFHAADREEIDHFLHCTPLHCKIIIANPHPCVRFADLVKKSGRDLIEWKNGPEDLPIG